VSLTTTHDGVDEWVKLPDILKEIFGDRKSYTLKVRSVDVASIEFPSDVTAKSRKGFSDAAYGMH